MLKKRLIAVILDCDGQVVQSVGFKHTNVVHYDTLHAVEAFAGWSVDEIVLLNVSRSPGSRKKFVDTLSEVTKNCFIPISAGGWIRDQKYAEKLLRSGADKLVVNTLISDKPDVFSSMANIFGNQCMVASVDLFSKNMTQSSVVVDRGRRAVSDDVTQWTRMCQALGAGEILFNSISFDGARRGYDLPNLEVVCNSVEIPVIGFGGVFSWEHLHEGIRVGCSAVAAANQFHYQENATRRAKTYLATKGVNVRTEGRSYSA
jgi:cyclase